MQRQSGPQEPASSEDLTKIKTQFNGSDVGIARGNCPFCGVPLSEPDNPADHEDWCRDTQLCSCWICGGAA